MGRNVQIPFGDEFVTAELPDDTFFVPNTAMPKLDPIDDLDSALDEVLENPLGSPPLLDLAKPESRVVIAFDDPTVPAYGPVRGVAIKRVLGQLDSAGVSRDNITLLCANALHRKFTPDELAAIIGEDLVETFGPRCLCHDAEDPDALVYLGKTESGHDVEVHRLVVESDLLVYVNAASIRGFSGGWKSVCVGLSTYRSIRHHHTPDGMSMSIADNRMHQALDEMGRLLEARVDTKFFKIDCIEANPFQTARVFAGNTWETRRAILEVLKRQFPARRDLSDTRHDVILYGVPAWSPYAIFASMNPILTLVSSGLGYLGGTIQALGKPGCTVVMATPCPNEWDEVHHPSYRDVWDNVLTTSRDAYVIDREFKDRFAAHKGYIEMYRHQNAFHPVHGIMATQPLRRLRHAGRVIVAGIREPAVAEHLGFLPARDVTHALHMCREIHDSGFSLAYAQHPAAPTKMAM